MKINAAFCRLALGAALCFAVTSCDGLTSPRDVEGVYVLTNYQGEAVPTRWLGGAGGQGTGAGAYRVLADTFYLRAGREGERVSVLEQVSVDGSDTTVVRFASLFDYDVTGPHVRFVDRRARGGDERWLESSYQIPLDGRSLRGKDVEFTYRGRTDRR